MSAQDRLYDKFQAAGYDADVAIADLYEHVLQKPATAKANADMQQALGTMITRANRKLVDEKIVPGETKRTYRLTKTVKPT